MPDFKLIGYFDQWVVISYIYVLVATLPDPTLIEKLKLIL